MYLCHRMSSARNEILERIRKALSIPTKHKLEEPDWEAPVYAQKVDEAGEAPDLAVLFAENFTVKNGQFFYVENYGHLYDDIAGFVAERGLRRIACWEAGLAEVLAFKGIAFETGDAGLESVEASFTLCEALVARTGSVLVSSSQGAGRRLTIYPPIHVVVATTSQIVPDVEDGLAMLREKYDRYPSMISLVSGPSRTADIEKTLVLGAHGPKEIVVFLVDDTAPATVYEAEDEYYPEDEYYSEGEQAYEHPSAEPGYYTEPDPEAGLNPDPEPQP